MKIIINEFPSPSLKRRLNKMGFENIILVPKNDKVTFEDFEAISIFDERISNDDAGISFRDDKYCIHHGNDNWFKLEQENLDKLKDFSKIENFYIAPKQILLLVILLLIHNMKKMYKKF